MGALLVVAGCTSSGTGDQEEVVTEAEATTTPLDPEEEAERDRRAEVVEAREAAWGAHMEVMGSMPADCLYLGDGRYPPREERCRSAENEDLPATMTGRALLGEVQSVLEWAWDGYIEWEQWDMDVQSVVFPSDDLAIVETCLYYEATEYWQDGEPFGDVRSSHSGFWTVQSTDIMELTDEGWKLELWQRNLYHRHETENGDGSWTAWTEEEVQADPTECPVDPGDDERLSDDEVQAVREDIESTSEPQERARGVMLHEQLREDFPEITLFEQTYCPNRTLFMNTVEYISEEQFPSFFEGAWYALYDDPWTTDDYQSFGEGHPLHDCYLRMNRAAVHRAHSSVGRSDVYVEDVMWSETMPVAYLTVCQEVEAEPDYTTSEGESIEPFTARYIESLRLEEDIWIIANRWDHEIETGHSCHL